MVGLEQRGQEIVPASSTPETGEPLMRLDPIERPLFIEADILETAFPKATRPAEWTQESATVVFPPGEEVLWRYMPLEQLFVLLWRRALRFSPLSAMKDASEGKLPSGAWEETRRELPQHILESALDADAIIDSLVAQRRRGACISCWYINRSDSPEMWRRYAPRNGVAIRSTIHRLKSCFVNKYIPVMISPVKYFHPAEQADSYTKEATVGNLFIKYTHDENAQYENEKELRALSFQHSVECGIDLPIDVEVLIESVVLSPELQAWAAPVITEAIRRFGFAGRIEPCDVQSVSAR